ncbi:hypothetical protein [Litorimonas sp. WD9-15]|uniref:hypothetical protein n=1 Tax=Litorimonas sp. WD9-15 TaxID=3418716 RepID=UPI003CFCE995
MKHWIPVLLVTVSASSAFASEDLRGETFCFPAKDVPKLVSELAEVDEDRRDIVDVRLQPRFIIKDDGIWPERFYLAKDGELVTDIPFSRETGATPTFLESAKARPDTDICVDDPTRADRPADDEGLYFEMGLSPLFHNESGTYSLDELKEGAKDGKKFYKKMLPGVVAMLMPDTDYFAVKMVVRDAVPTVAALTERGQTPLTLEPVKDMWIVSLDDIKDLDATGMTITGGAYELQPVPSPKTLRQFGWGDATDEK